VPAPVLVGQVRVPGLVQALEPGLVPGLVRVRVQELAPVQHKQLLVHSRVLLLI